MANLHYRRSAKLLSNDISDDYDDDDYDANDNDDERQNLIDKTEQYSVDNEKYEKSNRFNDHIPWKGILLAFTLTLIGIIIVIVFICSQMGWIAFRPDDNFTFLTLAFITLVPGLYHSIIAFRAYRGYDGYSFDDIADLN